MNEALDELAKEHENVKFVKVGFGVVLPGFLHADLSLAMQNYTLGTRPFVRGGERVWAPSYIRVASNPGAEEGEKSAWYPLFAHALNYYIKPRGFMQMTSQNFPSVNNDVYTTQRNHEDMIAALTLTFGTWSVISAMRDETTMTTLSSRASFTSNTNGITQ